MDGVTKTGFAVSVSGMNHYFGSGEARKQAIWDVSLDIAPGSLTVLMGPSGSGKTTVLTLMGCLRDVQEGSVRLLGEELNGASGAQVVALRKRIGFIFQAHNLHGSLTATQNVMMALQVHGSGDTAAQRRAAHHMLGLVGLADRVNYLPQNLSGGQKQRVAVARALVSNPEVVFADEPTAALDKESGMTVVDMLKDLGRLRGTTTVMVTHDNRILDRADRIVTLEDGRVVSDKNNT
ncbi:ATP-binding cassette domain-containing protein [Pseudaestuariivita rosea]|uniref:ATP-binding cassette domain-containing protein n=1 Tax=Pseudaestuariivita rosea TaxID=2763263 RepID=UPI001ABA1067|nr:ATP-binding cassette domain-containing protein [Pseudaestuariivita rosea]